VVSCFCTFPSSKRREGERETEREQEGIAGVSATYIPFCAVVSCFCHLPLFKKKRRRERDRERTRGNSGCIGDLHTFLRCGFLFLPLSPLQKAEKERERQRENKRE
jgi:hypothetical protein